jgi:hypothetical protein
MLMLKKLWQDNCGAVISPELAMVGAILIVGLIVGLSAVASGLFTEIEDVAAAVEAFDFTPTMVPGPVPPPPNITVQNPGAPRDGKPIGNITGEDGGPGIITAADAFGEDR